MKRLFCLMLVLCLLLAGCGKKEAAAPTEPATEAPTTVATEAPTTEATEAPTEETEPTTEATEPPAPVNPLTGEVLEEAYTGRPVAFSLNNSSACLPQYGLDKLDWMDMNAEKDGIMRAVYVRDVVKDYSGTDDYSGKHGRYGCGGMDGVSVGPVFGTGKNGPRKILLAEGICGDVTRTDNDHQVLLQYDPSIFDEYGQPLDQLHPHHNGPETCEARYFFYTGNTTWGIQNLEYDPATGYWFTAVYVGKKPEFENFKMFAVDGNISAKEALLEGRGSEAGLLLTSAKIGCEQKDDHIYSRPWSGYVPKNWPSPWTLGIPLWKWFTIIRTC